MTVNLGPDLQLVFDPALPWPVVAVLAGLALIASVFALWRGLGGWALRGLAGLAAVAALAGPGLQRGDRIPLNDIVILLDDRTASARLPGREAQTDAAVDSMAAQIAAMPGTELRRVTVEDDETDGSLIGAALTKALAAEPADRVAGVIAVTDGQAHDPAAIPATAPAPVQVLLTGANDDWDRRLVIEDAPAFGLIDKPLTIRLRVEDQGAVPAGLGGQPVMLRWSLDGGAEQVLPLTPGTPAELQVTPKHAGQNVVAMAIDPPTGVTPPELTDRNNAAAVQINGVRDRLRVLLVSGEPHAGERTWRNLLKSDANVDLIHFTILRPPDKMDGVPVDELSLIAFPTGELFMNRIDDFDLIIFDRYRVRGILPPAYFENINRYVREGGAILVAAGPEMATVESLNLSPLGAILPAMPNGRVLEQPFRPELTEQGKRHPVTAGLPGAPPPGAEGDAAEPDWGRWLRMAQVNPDPQATVAMSGAEGLPLLILNRVGEGRVAMLTSDQVWLWGRGFEGGGPQLELLRRIAHWSMKEPDLEEEALTATVADGQTLTITRRTMKDTAGPVQVTGPDDFSTEIPLERTAPGRFTARWTAPAQGLYRLKDGDIERVVALGPAAPREFEETVATEARLGPLAEATGGTVLRIADGLPDLRQVRADRSAFGQSVGGPWIGITPREAASVTGLRLSPLLPDWAWLALIALSLIGGWLVEGRRRG
ncbi:hypothetical protein [Paracoccus pacificus]|uniref:Glutamine amidotransferase n=1 Tax=Paracoccus pacificus TaxID=1463598 RepID=A0ABW4R5Y9_9RHOB